MKAALRLVPLILLGCCAFALAQFLTPGNPPNAISQAELTNIASKLVVGMPEQEVINWFTTNGGRMNASVQGTNDWTRIYFPSNGSFLEVRFVQRPAQSGLLYSTNQSGLRLVVQTNGILNGVWLGKTQIARTNAP